MNQNDGNTSAKPAKNLTRSEMKNAQKAQVSTQNVKNDKKVKNEATA